MFSTLFSAVAVSKRSTNKDDDDIETPFSSANKVFDLKQVFLLFHHIFLFLASACEPPTL